MRLPSRRPIKKFRFGRTLRSRSIRLLKLAKRRKPPLPFMSLRKPRRVYSRAGDLEVCLARSASDIRKAQKLRFEVFYREMDAIPSTKTLRRKRDEDHYDAICDHLLVLDRTESQKGGRKRPWPRPRAKVVGTYRVLRQEVAERHEGFYTQGEFNIAPLIAAKRADHYFMELGRSCVLKSYRNKKTVELLWRGLWTYIREHGVDVMIGCASFPGTDPKDHALALSFLYHTALAPEEWRVKAHPHLYVDMNMIPKEEINMKEALRALPPLIKGYLRVGAFVGDGAFVDHQFGTTDVFIILTGDAINPRYSSHFSAADEQEVKPIYKPKGIKKRGTA